MLVGHVETYTPEMIAGWAFDDANPAAVVSVEVLIDGAVAARLPANLPRLLDGRRNGFVFLLPPALRAGRRRAEVSVRFADGGTELVNSPRNLTLHRPARRVVCFNPNGRRVRHDEVVAYQQTPEEHIQRYANTGDWMVYDSSLKLLSFAELRVTNIMEWTDKEIDELNAEYDYCFLRGSNYVHEGMEWRELARLLGKLKIPAIPFSVGAQAPTRRKIDLPQKSIEVWKAFADHCATIGVRGAFTAEVFNDMGIRNVEIIGCPSLFRHNNPYLRLEPKPWSEIRKVAFNLRREVSPFYATDPRRYHEVQKKLIRYLDERFDLTVTVHGEAAEKAFFYKHPDFLPKYCDELTKSGWFDGSDNGRLMRVYESRLFYNEAPAQYDEMIRGMDLVLGFRVHGNLPAAACNVPAICIDYDTRSAELAEAFDLPTIGFDAAASAPLETLYRPGDFDKFNRNVVHHYRRLRDFLDRNGMAHNMLPV
jgi:hypothetical protein